MRHSERSTPLINLNIVKELRRDSGGIGVRLSDLEDAVGRFGSLGYGISFERARYTEVLKVTETVLEHVDGAVCCCSAMLGCTGPSLGLHCKITLIWPDKALSLIPAAQA